MQDMDSTARAADRNAFRLFREWVAVAFPEPALELNHAANVKRHVGEGVAAMRKGGQMISAIEPRYPDRVEASVVLCSEVRGDELPWGGRPEIGHGGHA